MIGFILGCVVGLIAGVGGMYWFFSLAEEGAENLLRLGRRGYK